MLLGAIDMVETSNFLQFALSYQYIGLCSPRDVAEMRAVMDIVQASISRKSNGQMVG